MGHRVLILAAGIGSGHNIAAGVLESCFQAAPEVNEVQRLDILESTNEVYRTLYDDGYFALVEALPWLVGWGYDANDPPFKLAKLISLWGGSHQHDGNHRGHQGLPLGHSRLHPFPAHSVGVAAAGSRCAGHETGRRHY